VIFLGVFFLLVWLLYFLSWRDRKEMLFCALLTMVFFGQIVSLIPPAENVVVVVVVVVVYFFPFFSL